MKKTTAVYLTQTVVFDTAQSLLMKQVGRFAVLKGKSTIKGGKTQVHLHDGRNIIVDDASEHKTGDSLKISLPEQKVLEHIKFGEGTRCMLVGGVHVGKLADVTDVIVKRSSMSNEVEFDGFGTVTDNVFSVGNCTLPGVEVSQ